MSNSLEIDHLGHVQVIAIYFPLRSLRISRIDIWIERRFDCGRPSRQVPLVQGASLFFWSPLIYRRQRTYDIIIFSPIIIDYLIS